MKRPFKFVTLLTLLFLIILRPVYSQPSPKQELEVALEKALKLKRYEDASAHCLALAKYFLKNKDKAQATLYLEKNITYAKKADNSRMIYSGYMQLGEINNSSKDYSRAEGNFQKALKYAEDLGEEGLMIDALAKVAGANVKLSKYKKAIGPVERILSYALQGNNHPLQQKCYEQLAEYHQKAGNVAKAIEFKNMAANESQQKQDRVNNLKLRQEIKHVGKEKKLAEDSLKEIKVISEARKLQIDLLHKDKEIAEIRIKEQNARLRTEAWIRNSIIVGTILAGALVLVILGSYRRKLEANKKIDLQNKSIKSSINYAKRIQEAMLPKTGLQKTLLPDSFVLFKPRDSVSGDFYWMSEIKNWYNPDVVFAAVDCTGHGVPGAFMSMIGINALNGIIARGIAEANQILEALDTEIRTTLQQDTTGNNDGMDVALCIYRKEKNIIEFSGAKNSLVYIQNNQLYQVKGDVFSIGGNFGKKGFSFNLHKISIDQPTMIYLFSDGYKDQFGGEKNSKFMAKRFNQLLLDIHSAPLEEQLAILERTIESWKGSGSQTDDILVMGVSLDIVGEG